MPIHHGSEGIVRTAAGTVAEVRAWTIEARSDLMDATVVGETARRFRPGLSMWGGRLDCFFDAGDGAGQGALAIGSEVALSLFPDGDGGGAPVVSGLAVVTTLARQATVAGAIEVSFGFRGSGPLNTGTAE